MFLSIHAATGAMLAQQTESAPVAFVVGMLSHYLLDAIPHGDEFLEEWHKNGNKKKVYSVLLLDAFAMLAYVVFLFSSGTLANPWVVAWGVLGSVLPDVIQAHYILTQKYFKRLCDFHVFNHNLLGRTMLFKFTKKELLTPKVGMFVQILFLLLVLRLS